VKFSGFVAEARKIARLQIPHLSHDYAEAWFLFAGYAKGIDEGLNADFVRYGRVECAGVANMRNANILRCAQAAESAQ
tara:strand:+ start:243 stop:476 length:234 start_codon:yes stop_codon:yes gene_type:complete